MICTLIAESIGNSCQVLDDDGRFAVIATSLKYSDGDPLPVFLENSGGRLRFFDDGGTILYLLGCGVRFDGPKDSDVLKRLVEPHGASLNAAGEVEIWFTETETVPAFEKYLASMQSIVQWETEQNAASVQ